MDPRTYAPAANTTRPVYTPTTRCCPHYANGPATNCPPLADLGYEGEDLLLLPIKKPAGGRLTEDQRQLDWLHAYARARAEQANSVLKTTFKALRRISLSPDVIGAIVAAALVLLHVEHNRTT